MDGTMEWIHFVSTQNEVIHLLRLHHRMQFLYIHRFHTYTYINNNNPTVTMLPRQAAVDPKSMLGRASDKITIIHFNDVADTEARDSEPCGGAARCKCFKTEIDNNKILI